MIYRTYRSATPTDVIQAANGVITTYPTLEYPRPQDAVDTARTFVREYSNIGYPRAEVRRHARNANVLIFRCWRRMDGAYCEERVDP